MGSFDDLIPKQPDTSSPEVNTTPDNSVASPKNQFQDLVPKQEAQQEPAHNSAFMAAIDGWNRAFGRTAEGGLQLLSNYLPDKFNKAVTQLNQEKEREFAQDLIDHPVASKIGEFAGYIGQEALLPVAKANLATKIASYAATGGALMGGQYGSPEQRQERGLYGAAMSGVFGAAGELGWMGAKSLLNSSATSSPGLLRKLFKPEAAATQEIASNISNTTNLNNMLVRGQAAERVGVTLTPGETVGGNILPQAEKGYLVSQQSKLEAAKYLNDRSSVLKTKVKDLIDNFVPEGDEVAKTTKAKMYEDLAPLQATTQTSEALLSHPVISNELQALNKNPLMPKALKEMPDNSVLKLDAVKKEIDSQLYNNKTFLNGNEKTISASEKSVLQDARAQIVDRLDSEYPQYAQARKIAERLTLKSQINKELGMIKPEPRAINGEVTLDQMYNKLWSTPDKQSRFIEAVKRTGGSEYQASDVIQVLNQIRQSPLESLLKAKSEGVNVGTSIRGNLMNGSATIFSRLSSFVDDLTLGRYNKALVDLTINGKWKPEVAKLMSKPNEQTLLMTFKKLLDKVSVAGPGVSARRVAQVFDGSGPQGFTDTYLPPPGDSYLNDESKK